jgi:hypothetical protein
MPKLDEAKIADTVEEIFASSSFGIMIYCHLLTFKLANKT